MHPRSRNHINLEGLPDELLIEICCRLPCKIAVRCKSISKRFLALISSRSFVERFIYYKHTSKDKEEHQKDWFFVFVSVPINILVLWQPTFHVQLPDPFYVNCTNWFMNFLGIEFGDTGIVGSSNGLLLLVTKRRAGRDRYHICNPITKHSAELPPPPCHDDYGNNSEFRGFVCEPYYHVEGDKLNLSPCQRFRVVVANPFSTAIEYGFQFSIFSSETGQWSTKFVSCPKGFEHFGLSRVGTGHGGRVYFMGQRSLLACHPFNDDDDLQLKNIDYPAELDVSNGGHLGVSCGSLRICDVDQTTRVVSVWELKEESFQWGLLHSTVLPPAQKVLALHPTNSDVLFFESFLDDQKFLGNLETMQCQPPFNTLNYQLSETMTSLDFPWWPTPLPSINGEPKGLNSSSTWKDQLDEIFSTWKNQLDEVIRHESSGARPLDSHPVIRDWLSAINLRLGDAKKKAEEEVAAAYQKLTANVNKITDALKQLASNTATVKQQWEGAQSTFQQQIESNRALMRERSAAIDEVHNTTLALWRHKAQVEWEALHADRMGGEEP